jgi:hypothetical protein
MLWLAGLVGTDAVGASLGAGPLERQVAAPQAGAPTVVSYQGQVIVSGVAYTGTGYFKFKIVDQPACTIVYWSNDGSGTSGDCSASTDAVSLGVSNGLFSVLLGDTTVTHMTALPASVFGGTVRYLRVWFSSTGSAGSFVHLAPDRRIAAVPYALQATNVDYLDGQDSADFATALHNHDDAYVNVSGDTMTGNSTSIFLRAGAMASPPLYTIPPPARPPSRPRTWGRAKGCTRTASARAQSRRRAPTVASRRKAPTMQATSSETSTSPATSPLEAQNRSELTIRSTLPTSTSTTSRSNRPRCATSTRATPSWTPTAKQW